MADEETQQAPQVPTVQQQNPFGIHTPSESERMEDMRRIARVAEERILEQLARQHPVVASLIAERDELRDKLFAKKPKKPKADDPPSDPNT